MKKSLPFVILCLSAFITHLSYAQVTLVSDNTNLTSGFVLPNGTPLLQSDSGMLYTTNGTTATVITTSVAASDSGSSALYKNQLYFAGINASKDIELWATDGTSGGTRLVKNISAAGSSQPDNFFILNDKLYFTANDGTTGRELWVTDGTTNNTTLVTNIDGAATNSIPDDAQFFSTSSVVYFTAVNNQVLGLYKITSGGVSLVKANIGDEIDLTSSLYAAAIGNKVVFTVTSGDFVTGTAQLWSTDGTTNNTVPLKDFGAGSNTAFIPTPVLFKGLLYFSYTDILGATSALWTTDGTPAKTTLFKSFDFDLNSGAYLGLLNAFIFDNKLYFNGYSINEGSELWSTDGTAANTTLFKDINPGIDGSDPFFLLDYGAVISAITSNSAFQFTYQSYHTVYNGKMYFTANDGTHGIELWSSDGTANGTTLVKDINANGDGMSLVEPAYYTTNGIYFSADNGSAGNEPWLTNGTSAGTNIVADINKNGNNGSDPTYLFVYKNQLYFNASNGGENSDLYKINQSLTTLPVSLVNFTASLQQQSVLLNWITTNEINTARFSVERSTDGIHFSEAGATTALGNSASQQAYQFNDVGALQAGSSVLYYRLKTIDKDGNYSYSSVLTVQLQNGVFTFKLSPNPVRNQLTVNFSTGNASHISLRITDANGKQVYQQTYQSSQGSSVQQIINAAKFAKGTYFIQLITDKETKTLRFIKQ